MFRSGLEEFRKGFESMLGQRCVHVTHPCLPFALADFESPVRFPQAQPPAALRILRRSTQELHQESRELFNGAAEVRRKQRPQNRILLDASVERFRERTDRKSTRLNSSHSP